MGKLIDLGWYSSSDAIPEPTSILLGKNLRQNSDQASKKQKQDQDKEHDKQDRRELPRS